MLKEFNKHIKEKKTGKRSCKKEATLIFLFFFVLTTGQLYHKIVYVKITFFLFYDFRHRGIHFKSGLSATGDLLLKTSSCQQCNPEHQGEFSEISFLFCSTPVYKNCFIRFQTALFLSAPNLYYLIPP
jgi:hypothetical protein